MKAKVAKNPGDFLTGLRLAWDLGKGTVGDEATGNGLWPEWNPAKVEDIIA